MDVVLLMVKTFGLYPPPTGPAPNMVPGAAMSPLLHAPALNMPGSLPGYESIGGYVPPPILPQPAPAPPGPAPENWSIPSLTEEEARAALENFVSAQCCYGSDPAKEGVITNMEPCNTFRVSPGSAALHHRERQEFRALMKRQQWVLVLTFFVILTGSDAAASEPVRILSELEGQRKTLTCWNQNPNPGKFQSLWFSERIPATRTPVDPGRKQIHFGVCGLTLTRVKHSQTIPAEAVWDVKHICAPCSLRRCFFLKRASR
ncbi:uncharacterized protein LOC105358483 isoform X1 [Oryzias latipes]